jgi:hypothetical protein
MGDEATFWRGQTGPIFKKGNFDVQGQEGHFSGVFTLVDSEYIQEETLTPYKSESQYRRFTRHAHRLDHLSTKPGLCSINVCEAMFGMP